MTRYLKVFGQVAVQEVIMRELGMTMAQFVQLGLAVVGHFFGQEVMSVDQDYRALGISRDSSLAFFRRITSTITELRNKTKDQQSYDGDWLFAWNPLESKPLIAFDPSFPDRVLCPIPSYLIRRTQGGIFFDLINASGFDNSFGESFQAYVGEVIKLVCRPPQFTALAEEEFHVGKKRMDGVDWILADNTAHLFIECKTKRLKLAAKIRADTVALEEALATMATAIVQNYKNILLALNGKTKWVRDNRPIYPIILTLEDWHIFSPSVQDSLREHVEALLTKQNIPVQLIEQMPYSLMSASEFEVVTQVIAQTNIAAVMTKKTSPERRSWGWLSFLLKDFEKSRQLVNPQLFPDEVNRLMTIP